MFPLTEVISKDYDVLLDEVCVILQDTAAWKPFECEFDRNHC